MMKNNKSQIAFSLLLAGMLVLQGCSWMFKTPTRLDSHLQEAMQKPMAELVQDGQQSVPLKLHYEFKHKPLPQQKLAVGLEIKPSAELAACAYSVKLSGGLKLVTPLKVVNLGNLKAGETYNEEVVVVPVDEGLHEIHIYFAVATAGSEPQIKAVSIPLSTGPFQQRK